MVKSLESEIKEEIKAYQRRYRKGWTFSFHVPFHVQLQRKLGKGWSFGYFNNFPFDVVQSAIEGIFRGGLTEEQNLESRDYVGGNEDIKFENVIDAIKKSALTYEQIWEFFEEERTKGKWGSKEQYIKGLEARDELCMNILPIYIRLRNLGYSHDNLI